MISTRFVKLAVSGVAIGMALSGGHAGPATSHASPSDSKQLQVAAGSAADATAQLAAKNYARAVAAAEVAVSYSPRDASYRMLLAQAYLGAGRFTSAEASFADTLTLSPDNARAALNLALTEIALGKRDMAMSTLSDYRERLSASDYGLAIGLAGNADMAVDILENAVRGGASDSKTRQNLGLAYALAGKWADARLAAAQDLGPQDVDQRIGQWAEFVRPASSYDQVASLLGVRAVRDAGQPARLALNAVTAPATAVATAEPLRAGSVEIALDAPVAAQPIAQSDHIQAVRVGTAPTPVSAQALAAAEPEAVVPVFETKTHAPVIRAAPTAMKQVIVPAAAKSASASHSSMPTRSRSVTAGRFVVQLGAFQNAAVSQNSWSRLSSRYGLNGFDPANSVAHVNGVSFVRLSIGGFSTRNEASAICTRIRTAGGTCFVRGVLGDTPAQWVQRGMPKSARPVRMAAR